MDRTDRMLAEVGRCAERLGAIEARLEHYDQTLERFMAQHMPHLESLIQKNDDRLRGVEIAHAATRTKVGFWGGIAGVGAVVYTAIKQLLS